MDNSLLLLLVPQIIIAYGITWGIRRWAMRYNVMDVPNARSSHTTVTPRGGGVAVVLTVTLSVIGLSLVTGTLITSEILAYLVGSMLIALVGFIDDVRSLSTVHRFGAQALVALVMVYLLGYPQTFQVPLFGIVEVGIFGAVITVIWIVGLINAYNFMDGIDGIAGGNAVIVALGWLSLYGLSFNPNISVVVITIAIIGGCIGFLGHNWHPARIFMGDVGSTFLGFTFAVLPLMLQESQVPSLTSAALLLWPFLFDTIVTFGHRMIQGKNVFAAHREHMYQRLVIAGLPHAVVSSTYMVLSLMGVIFANAYLEGSRIILIAPLALGIGLAYVTYLFSTRYRFAVRPIEDDTTHHKTETLQQG
ncbi:MAG: glycosyltransferase family 4 protein [Anaerolineae bacterium]|nr:glycosyltransferase family 4 protein [Anaerolineae bacterium]